MADRYQDRRFPADDPGRGGERPASARGESDPLAELARLIGQTDPFGSMGRANQQVQPRTSARDHYQPPATDEEIHASSLQFVRKLSGFTRPSKANEAAFERAVGALARSA